MSWLNQEFQKLMIFLSLWIILKLSTIIKRSSDCGCLMQLYNTEFGLENSRKLASTGPHGACPIHFYLSLLPSAFREKATVYMVRQKTKTFLMMAALHQSDSRGWPTHRKQGLEHRSKAGDPTAKFTYLTRLIEQIGSLGAGGQRIIIIIILLCYCNYIIIIIIIVMVQVQYNWVQRSENLKFP